MQQALILAWGIEIPNSPKQQVSNARACIERLASDPRVRAIYGTTGQSTGCAVLCETQNLQEAQRLASLIQVSGLPIRRVPRKIPSVWQRGREVRELANT